MLPIRHRNNSLFYRSQRGARVGDIYMALIYTAELHGENPLEYLVALLVHSADVAADPAAWLPWTFRATLALEAEEKTRLSPEERCYFNLARRLMTPSLERIAVPFLMYLDPMTSAALQRSCLAILNVGIAACGRVGFASNDALIDGHSVVSEGLVLWLQMDESDPVRGILDAAGGHTVSCTTACPTSGPGKYVGGFHFSGQQLTIAWRNDLDARAGYTVGAWVLLEALPAAADGLYSCAFTKPVTTAPDGNSYSLCVDANGSPYSYTTQGPSDSDTLQNDQIQIIPLPPRWYHLAVSWNPVTKLKSFYVDGVPLSTNVDIDFDMSSPVIGADTFNGPTYFWHGMLDDVVFYNRVLTEHEIRGLAEKA